MARNLYRFYLYLIFIALIIFAVVVTSQLLSTLFAFTPLRGSYNTPPSQASLIQALVFAIVGWIIAGALGGLHYWLIRRDQSSDPSAGDGAIRAFFLNMTEAIGVLTVMPLIGFAALGSWAFSYSSDNSYTIGVALPVLLMVIGLELERRRLPASTKVALVFQRLHFFGVQLILLGMLIGAFSSGFRSFIDIALFNGQGECSDGYCQAHQVAGLLVQLLWFSAGWLLYGWVTGRDFSRLVRMLMHGLGLAIGIGWTIYGVFVGLEVVLAPLFHVSLDFTDVLGIYANHDFLSPLAVGILATAIYHLLLSAVARRGLIGQGILRLTEQTIAALLLAAAFWWGCGILLYTVLQAISPAPTAPDGSAWTAALALLLPGLGYIPLDLLIRHRFALDPASAIGARRSLVLALLAGGTLSFAIGGAITLYAWLTALLGSPITDWPQLAHGGLGAAIVGAALILIYIWPLRGEHLLTRTARTSQPATPETPVEQPATPETIENILDELLAGKITRTTAALQLRQMYEV